MNRKGKKINEEEEEEKEEEEEEEKEEEEERKEPEEIVLEVPFFTFRLNQDSLFLFVLLFLILTDKQSKHTNKQLATF